jgi:hypothetical protein
VRSRKREGECGLCVVVKREGERNAKRVREWVNV